MDVFKVQVDGKAYNVLPREDETFLIVTSDNQDIVITPDLMEEGIIWNLVSGNASEELVQSIGEAIEHHEM
jgi:hypothetical protein